MATLEDITIYIPTINRPKFLDRCLGFLSSYEEALNILIFDSSDIPNRDINIEICNTHTHKDLKITQIWEKGTNTKFDNMGQMFSYVLENHIKTKYVVFCGDDDFLFIHNLVPHMEFLETHEDYVVCHGNMILFTDTGEKLSYLNAACCLDLYQEDPLERFIWYCLNASSIQYGPARTVDILRAHRFCNQIDNRWLSSEVLPTLLTILYGKVKNLGTISVLQEWGHPKIVIKSDGKKQLLNNWLFRLMNTDPTWIKSFIRMMEIFVNEVKNITGMEEDYIYSIFEAGYSYRILHTYQLFLQQSNWHVKNKFTIDKYTVHHGPPLSDIGKTRILKPDWDALRKILK